MLISNCNTQPIKTRNESIMKENISSSNQHNVRKENRNLKVTKVGLARKQSPLEIPYYILSIQTIDYNQQILKALQHFPFLSSYVKESQGQATLCFFLLFFLFSQAKLCSNGRHIFQSRPSLNSLHQVRGTGMFILRIQLQKKDSPTFPSITDLKTLKCYQQILRSTE